MLRAMPNNPISVRKRPRYFLVTALRRAGVTQREIAQRVGATQAIVSLVLARKINSRYAEAIWTEVARILTPPTPQEEPTNHEG